MELKIGTDGDENLFINFKWPDRMQNNNIKLVEDRVLHLIFFLPGGKPQFLKARVGLALIPL
jgi:hypothetical protein